MKTIEPAPLNCLARGVIKSVTVKLQEFGVEYLSRVSGGAVGSNKKGASE